MKNMNNRSSLLEATRLAKRLTCVAVCYLLSTQACLAATVTFLGQPFESTVGSGFVAGVDRIYGSITFDAIGDSQARSFSLTATNGGNPAFTMNVADTENPVSIFNVTNNTFSDWQNGAPTTWRLTVVGSAFASDAPEQISISSVFGDLAAIDLQNLGEGSLGRTRGSGTMQPIPEPSSFALLVLPAVSLVLRRTRRK